LPYGVGFQTPDEQRRNEGDNVDGDDCGRCRKGPLTSPDADTSADGDYDRREQVCEEDREKNENCAAQDAPEHPNTLQQRDGS
jgi:hypothetical protein